MLGEGDPRDRHGAGPKGAAGSRPYRTVFEPTKSRKGSEKRLFELLIEHYDALERWQQHGTNRAEDM